MASQHKTVMESTPGQDAVALLMADHHRVARLFAQFNALKATGSDEEKSAVVAQICQELTVHTTIEEELFYPAVRKAMDDEDLMDEALVEHAGAKELIAQLQTAHTDDDLYDARVTVLGEQIDHHVAEEEGSMFPQARASGVDMLSLGATLLERKAELVANRGMLRIITGAGGPGDDGQDDNASGNEETNPELHPARRTAPRRPVPSKRGSKKKTSRKAR